jgi:sugar phosphate permease
MARPTRADPPAATPVADRPRILAGARSRADGLFYGWWIVIAAGGIQFLQNALLGSAFGAYVVVLRDEFGWSKTALSAASSLREMESGVIGPVQGMLLQRFGPRRICQIGIVIFASGFFLFSRIESLPAFFATFLVMAIGASLCGYLTLTYAGVQWFERRRATALSLMSVGGALGGLAVRATVVSMESLGWRETAVISGVLILVIGLPLAQVIRFRPADYGMHPDGVDPATESPEDAAVSALTSAQEFTLREAVRTRAFWFVSFGHGSALFVVSAMNVHLISYLKDDLGYTLGFATTLSLMLPLLFLVSTLSAGPLGDRFSKRWLVVGCMFMHAGGLLILSYAQNLAMVVAFALLHGLAWGFRGPQMAAIRADYFGRKSFPTIMGVSNGIIIIGTILGPIIAGYVYDQTGEYRIGFNILAALAAAGSIFFVLATKPPPPAPRPELDPTATG